MIDQRRLGVGGARLRRLAGGQRVVEDPQRQRRQSLSPDQQRVDVGLVAGPGRQEQPDGQPPQQHRPQRARVGRQRRAQRPARGQERQQRRRPERQRRQGARRRVRAPGAPRQDQRQGAGRCAGHRAPSAAQPRSQARRCPQQQGRERRVPRRREEHRQPPTRPRRRQGDAIELDPQRPAVVRREEGFGSQCQGQVAQRQRLPLEAHRVIPIVRARRELGYQPPVDQHGQGRRGLVRRPPAAQPQRRRPVRVARRGRHDDPPLLAAPPEAGPPGALAREEPFYVCPVVARADVDVTDARELVDQQERRHDQRQQRQCRPDPECAADRPPFRAEPAPQRPRQPPEPPRPAPPRPRPAAHRLAASLERAHSAPAMPAHSPTAPRCASPPSVLSPPIRVPSRARACAFSTSCGEAPPAPPSPFIPAYKGRFSAVGEAAGD